MKLTTKQLRSIVKEELSKFEEAKPSEISMHGAAVKRRNGSGLIAFGSGMRTLKAVMSNLEDADDQENAELVKIAMQDLEKAMKTMREV